MVSSASARDRFYRTIEPLLGAEAADFLMDALPPVDWSEIATKTDLVELRAELKGDMAELRTELKGDIAELKGDIAAVRGELGDVRGELGELRGELGDLRGELGDLRGDLGDMRGAMVTKADLGELLRLHVDGRMGAISRQLFLGIATLHVTMTAALVAAVRL